jgi:Ca2+-binding RTX toxin-like protein
LPQHDYANSENDITAIEQNLDLESPDAILTYEDTDETRGGADNPLTESDVNALIKAKDSALDEAVEVNITGNTAKTVDFSKYDSMKEVHLFKGNQAIKFNDEGGNVAHVVGDGYVATNLNGEEVTADAATGEKNITLGGGGDLAVVDSSKAKVTVTGGKGDDTLMVREAAPVTFDMSKGGEDKVLLASDEATENVTLKGYKSSLGGGIVTGAVDTEQIVNAITDGGAIKFGDAKVTIGGAKVTFADNASANNTTFNLFDEDGDKQAVGFTHKEGGVVNVSSSKDDYVLVGNWQEDKSGASTLLGGKGDDTLLGGSGDVLNADGGSNQIKLNNDAQRDGATIVLSTGRTTISGVNSHLAAGDHFDEEQGDTIQADLTKAKVTYEDGVIRVKGDKLRGEIVDVTQAEDGTYVTQMFQSGSRLVKAAIAAKDSETTINADVGANYFKGDKSAVDFTTFEGTVNVDLSEDWASTLDGTVAGFNGINQLQAGEYDATLKGSSANETLSAGIGNATLYGGGGKNVLVGSAENADRDGRVAFLVLGAENGARNTIQSFTFADDVEDHSLADVLEIDTRENLISNVYIKNDNDVVLEVSNKAGTASETATVEGAVGKNMYVTDSVIAQVNTTSLTYDGDASFFVATGTNAGITIDNDNVTDAQIWLGNQGNKTFIGDIRTIDASDFDGRAELAGNDTNNTIMGGSGKNSLWGGNGGDDLLIGGSGANMFFYTNGNGNDTIQGVKEGDVVYLSAVTLENLAGTEFGNSSITMNFNDGGKLTINDGGSKVGIVLGEQTYYVNSERNDFTTTKPE